MSSWIGDSLWESVQRETLICSCFEIRVAQAVSQTRTKNVPSATRLQRWQFFSCGCTIFLPHSCNARRSICVTSLQSSSPFRIHPSVSVSPFSSYYFSSPSETSFLSFAFSFCLNPTAAESPANNCVKGLCKAKSYQIFIWLQTWPQWQLVDILL